MDKENKMSPSDDKFLDSNYKLIKNVLINPKDREIPIFIEGESSEVEEVNNTKVSFF